MPSTIKELYDSISERKDKPEDFEPYRPGKNGRVDRCAQLVCAGSLRNSGCLLDVGGATGDLGSALSDLFEKRITVDISRVPLRAAAAKGNIVHRDDVDANGLFFDEESVDLIVALDFIEHIIDPEKFARECFRVLKKGGQVFINTPNIQFWKHQQELLCTGVFPHTSGDREIYHGGHLAFYTVDDMQKIFGAANFTAHMQFRDEEGFTLPPPMFLELLTSRTTIGRIEAIERLSNSNILYSCTKP